MPRIDNIVINYNLCVNLYSKIVRQKIRAFNIEKNPTIKELERLLAVGFIWETHYLEWQFNVLLVKKAQGMNNVSRLHQSQQGVPKRIASICRA